MRECILISVRTLTVLAFVVALPLLALPPVSARVSDWTNEFRIPNRMNRSFADIGKSVRTLPDSQATDEDVTCWQAKPVVGPHIVAAHRDLAMNAEPDPLSSRKPSLPLNEQPTAKVPSPRVAANPQLQEIRQNLVKLGAQSMRLDEVAGKPAAYHFSCLMPLGNRAVYCRQFATTDSDPIRAMERVLDEVERWRGSQSSL